MGLQTLRDEDDRFRGHCDQPHAARIPFFFGIADTFCTLKDISLWEVKKESKPVSSSFIVNSGRRGPMSYVSFPLVQHFAHRSSMETKEWVNCVSDLRTQEPRSSCHHVTQSKDHHWTLAWQLWTGLARSYRGLLPGSSLVSFTFSTLDLVFVFERVGNDRSFTTCTEVTWLHLYVCFFQPQLFSWLFLLIYTHRWTLLGLTLTSNNCNFFLHF